jgi:hypothetical protein
MTAKRPNRAAPALIIKAAISSKYCIFNYLTDAHMSNEPSGTHEPQA